MTKSLSMFAVAAALLLGSAASAGEFVRLDDYEMDSLHSIGFEMPRAAKVNVQAVGLRPRFSSDLTTYAWILDATTREVVWTMLDESTKRVGGKRNLRECDATVDLAPGRYELHAYAGSHWSWGGRTIHIGNLKDIGKLIDKDKNGRWEWKGEDHEGRWNWNGDKDGNVHIDGRDDRNVKREVRDCWVSLSADGLDKNGVRTFEPNGALAGALLRHVGLGDDAIVREGFTLDRPGSLRIYAFAEQPRDAHSPADQGWIVNTRTRERVWEMTERNTRTAGGAEKNRVFDGEVQLEAGTYELVYVTDDSHAAEAWNAPPPEDPLNWGVTVLPGKAFDVASFHVAAVAAEADPLLDMRRVRDDEYLEKPFRLARAGSVRVVALGEWNSGSDDFADRAWIEKAGGGDVVWEMTDDNTVPAGGAEKNRMFDGNVELAAGDYVACYATDGSHAFRSWNAGAPFEPNAWGMALYPGPGVSATDVKEIAASQVHESDDVLARIQAVGNDQHRQAQFKLDRGQKVHVMAVGEGERSGLVDYAWIEDAKSGDVVWEMTYRNSRAAGGARKNRVFDGDVMLDAGTYELHNETDDSHAFPAWNAAAPRDPRRWGAVVTRGK